jgi:hypothetical protein
MKERFVRCEFPRGACRADGDFLYDSWFDGNVNLIVGEMLAMFPSSKESRAGIGLLNESIYPDRMQSSISIAHMEPCLRGSKYSCERKRVM